MIQPVFKRTEPTFGIRRLPTKKIQYAPKLFIEKEVGKFKDYDIIISKHIDNNNITSRLIYIKDKYGNWIKSKLKYLEDGVWKVLKGGKNA
jgi:hypothetical protein